MLKQRAVGQPGERIVVGQTLKGSLGGLAFGDILNCSRKANDPIVPAKHELAGHDELADGSVSFPDLNVDAFIAACPYDLGLSLEHPLAPSPTYIDITASRFGLKKSAAKPSSLNTSADQRTCAAPSS